MVYRRHVKGGVMVFDEGAGMSEPITAAQYIRLGAAASLAQHPQQVELRQYQVNLYELRNLVMACGFPAGLASAESLMTEARELAAGQTQAASTPLTGSANATMAAIIAEADNRPTIALEVGVVSKRLRDFPGLLPPGKQLTDAQKELLREAIRCIECRAYRAGAVMGWNLAYDYIRRWVFSTKLADFNKGLARVCGGSVSITDYEDFFEVPPTERQVVDAMADPGTGPIIGGKLRAHLVQHLDYRNKYAHASEKTASAHKTNAFIENMIDIITAAPFA